jgi:hypothetical protein
VKLRGLISVLEIGEDSLRRLGSQVGDVRLVFQSAYKGLEHKIERAGLGQGTAFVGRGADDFFAIALIELHVRNDRGWRGRLPESLGQLGGLFFEEISGLLGRGTQPGQPGLRRLTFMIDRRENISKDVELVGPIPFLGRSAVDHGIGEAADVPRGFPDPRIHDDRAVQPDHVVAHPDVVAPPGVLDIPLELNAQRTVVPEPVDPTVNLARRKNQAAALAQGDQLVHVVQHYATSIRGMNVAKRIRVLLVILESNSNDSQWVAAQLGDQVEAIDLSG